MELSLFLIVKFERLRSPRAVLRAEDAEEKMRSDS